MTTTDNFVALFKIVKMPLPTGSSRMLQSRRSFPPALELYLNAAAMLHVVRAKVLISHIRISHSIAESRVSGSQPLSTKVTATKTKRRKTLPRPLLPRHEAGKKRGQLRHRLKFDGVHSTHSFSAMTYTPGAVVVGVVSSLS